MACLEHVCNDCGAVWLDNDPGRQCPRCGSDNSSRYFDELPEYDPPEPEPAA